MANQRQIQSKIVTVPNLLSLFRLLLIPLAVWLYISKKAYGWTAAVLTLSAATDVVDGFIARRFGMVSDFGKMLDPVADKLTQIAMLFCLVIRFPKMLLPLCVLAVKELLSGIVGLLVIRKTGLVHSARWHGKAATVTLYWMMLPHLLWPSIPAAVSAVLIYGSTATMLLSAALYAKQYNRLLADAKNKERGM